MDRWICGLMDAHMEYTKRRNLNKLYYEVENKLLALISSLEAKRGDATWQTTLPNSNSPPIHQSTNPSLH